MGEKMTDRQQKRHERLVRLLEAARHMKRLQERRVRELEAEMQRLEERREALFAAFGSELFHADDLARLLRRNLDEAVRQAAMTRRMKEQGAAVLRDRHLQMKRIERLSRDAGRALRTSRHRDELLDIVERAVGAPRGKPDRRT